MPRDDYQKARLKDSGRRERARLDFESRKNRQADIDRQVKTARQFPKHVLRKQDDGSYVSGKYYFDVSRWNKQNH